MRELRLELKPKVKLYGRPPLCVSSLNRHSGAINIVDFLIKLKIINNWAALWIIDFREGVTYYHNSLPRGLEE